MHEIAVRLPDQPLGHAGLTALLSGFEAAYTARYAAVQPGARFQAVARRYRDQLGEWYGKEKAAKVGHAEAFEICEYGRRPEKKELVKLFPFFGD